MDEEILQDHWMFQVQQHRLLRACNGPPVEFYKCQRRIRRQRLPQPVYLPVGQIVIKQIYTIA